MIVPKAKESSLINDIKIHRYILGGPPVPLKRARIAGRRCYDSQHQQKLVHGIHLRNQLHDRPPITTAVSMTVIFYMELPASWSKKRRDALLGQPHISTPDYSNLLKYIEDVCVDAQVLKDDSLIFESFGRKIYDLNPRTEFVFVEIE